MKKLGKVGVSAFVVIALAGCATGNANNADDRFAAQADSQAAFDTSKTDWKTPFWERLTDDKARGFSRADDNAPSQPTAVTATENPPVVTATAARGLSPSPQSAADSGLRPKIGVYVAGDEHDSLIAYQFVNALSERAVANGVTLVKPDALADAIQASGACSAPTPAGCGQTLAIYPGVRALLIVRPTRQSSGDDRMNVQTRMIDTDFGIDYEANDTTLRMNAAGRVASADLALWSDRMLGIVADRVALAPWFTHSFALDGQDMYVSAGRDSGLAAGSVLTVRGDGTTVRAAGGRVVAWKPGPAVGKVRIKQLIGSHLAVAEQVSGQMPQPRDKLMAH